VNQEYIHSAGQADEFRTEPAFKLQGSYRNMNRLAEKVVPIMNDQEVLDLVLDHYRNESQTLTTGAEANLLKFKELVGLLADAEKARWEEIKKTFKRHQLVRGGDANDPVSRVVSQLAGFQAGLEAIQETLATQLSKAQSPQLNVDLTPVSQSLEALRAGMEARLEHLAAPARAEARPAGEAAQLARQLSAGLQGLRESLAQALGEVHSGVVAHRLESLDADITAVYNTLETLKDMARQQSINLRAAQDLLAARARQGTVEIELTQDMLANESLFLDKFHQLLAEREQRQTPPPGSDSTAKPST